MTYISYYRKRYVRRSSTSYLRFIALAARDILFSSLNRTRSAFSYVRDLRAIYRASVRMTLFLSFLRAFLSLEIALYKILFYFTR